ncbi:type II secretion system F family protein [Rugamonas aquatica]|uniref:Pilus assembly protein TadB n=1 Tax=Rugamonas aquatica TaxID=2743357 RepID=A0A6A7N4T2_9BURK|nr:type II secretion system F family protein [Rugamonas aquatica]MQA39898.1 pilus assembly protein TadB [Rugamonas aquatica]
MDYRFILFGVLVFCAVLLLVFGIYGSIHNVKGQQAQRVARRLRNAIGDNGSELAVSITKERLLSTDPGLQRLLQRIPGVAALDRLLLQSGRSWSAARLVAVMLAAAAGGAVLAMMLGLPSSGWLVGALVGGALPWWELNRAKLKRIARIEMLLPEALDLMSRAMKAGHAFPTALKMVGDEMPMPLAAEFRAVFDEVNFGISMPDALMGMAQRVPSADLRYFVVAVLIQRETGGNLTELLASISAIIRDRLRLLAQVRVMSAEGKMSAWVLGMLPFGVGGIMFALNREFLNILFIDPSGRKMLGGAALMMAVGFLVIRKITQIRV